MAQRTAKKKEPVRVGVSEASRTIVTWFHGLDSPEHKWLFIQMLRDGADKLEKQLVSSTGHKWPITDDDVPF